MKGRIKEKKKAEAEMKESTRARKRERERSTFIYIRNLEKPQTFLFTLSPFSFDLLTVCDIQHKILFLGLTSPLEEIPVTLILVGL